MCILIYCRYFKRDCKYDREGKYLIYIVIYKLLLIYLISVKDRLSETLETRSNIRHKRVLVKLNSFTISNSYFNRTCMITCTNI